MKWFKIRSMFDKEQNKGNPVCEAFYIRNPFVNHISSLFILIEIRVEISQELNASFMTFE